MFMGYLFIYLFWQGTAEEERKETSKIFPSMTRGDERKGKSSQFMELICKY